MTDSITPGQAALSLWCLFGEEWIIAADAEAALEEWVEWTGEDPEDGVLATITRVPDDRMFWLRCETIDARFSHIPPSALRRGEHWYDKYGMTEAVYGATVRAWIDAWPVPRYLASSNV